MKRLKINTCNKPGKHLSFLDTQVLAKEPLMRSTLPNGTYKPIPDKVLSLFQMASTKPISLSTISPNGIYKPIPDITFADTPTCECKFPGTLVSNLLLPSSHERQTCQSNSSGSRRLNRGNCCTPKFALVFFHKKSQPRAFPDFFSRLA